MPDDTPVPSPCNSICRMSPTTGFCEGCFRTIDEIATWSRMDDEEKHAVWRELASRRAQASATTTPPTP